MWTGNPTKSAWKGRSARSCKRIGSNWYKYNLLLINGGMFPKCRKLVHAQQMYMNTNFVLWFVFLVERLFSMEKYVMTCNWKYLTLQLFEIILFLKTNESFWDAELLEIAISGAHYENAELMHTTSFQDGNSLGTVVSIDIKAEYILSWTNIAICTLSWTTEVIYWSLSELGSIVRNIIVYSPD